MESEILYDMELHHSIDINDDLSVIRVPGGWLYSYIIQNEKYEVVTSSSSFVPYHEEFRPNR